MASETKDLQRVRRGCVDKDMRKLILAAVDTGARYKLTKNGIMFLGERGQSISAHFTHSDHRAVENFRQSLRSIGITIERKK